MYAHDTDKGKDGDKYKYNSDRLSDLKVVIYNSWEPKWIKALNFMLLI